MRHRIVRTKESTLANGQQFIVQGEPQSNKGAWKMLFGNDNPIWLEIGSGKGQFLCTQAMLHPEKNFLACEGLSDVYCRIVEKCIANNINNLRIIPCFMDKATEFFEDGELEKVFINFCDPWPKKKHIKRRLTNKEKLEEYKQILGNGKLIQFKTDNDPLFDFTLEEVAASGLEVLEMTRDLKNSEYEKNNVHTEYEDKFSGFGKTINYIVCRTKNVERRTGSGFDASRIKYILASGSPRRQELIKKITDNFEIIIPSVDERSIETAFEEKLEQNAKSPIPKQRVAKEICMQLAMAKAKEARRMLEEDPKYANVLKTFEDGSREEYLIIGCDTSVAIKDEILGKPKDRDDAVRMLRAESENLQYVVSGVAFVTRNKEIKFAEITTVEFNPLTEEQEAKIQKYCDTKEPYDKAGAYGIQLYGDGFVKEIRGSFDNVVGFPVEKIQERLKEFLK